MGKYCVYRKCKNYSSSELCRRLGIKFFPIPKPRSNLEKCTRWVEAIYRCDLKCDDVKAHHYVCASHFVGGNGPTEEHPDPIRDKEEEDDDALRKELEAQELVRRVKTLKLLKLQEAEMKRRPCPRIERKNGCEEWAVNCGREDLLKKNTSQLHKTRLLCADHFEDKQFMCHANKNSLVQNATPTIFNPTNRPKPSVSIYLKNSSTQTNSPRESKSTQFNYMKDLLVIDNSEDRLHPKLKLSGKKLEPEGQKLAQGGAQNEDSLVCHFVVPTFREELMEDNSLKSESTIFVSEKLCPQVESDTAKEPREDELQVSPETLLCTREDTPYGTFQDATSISEMKSIKNKSPNTNGTNNYKSITVEENPSNATSIRRLKIKKAKYIRANYKLRTKLRETCERLRQTRLLLRMTNLHSGRTKPSRVVNILKLSEEFLSAEQLRLLKRQLLNQKDEPIDKSNK